MIEFIFPFPPSVNHYYRSIPLKGKGCRMLLSKPGRLFKRKIKDVITEASYSDNGRLMPYAGRLKITYYFYPPDKRKRDISNYVKALEDAMQDGGAFLNDSQVDFFSVERGHPIPGGRAVVKIEEIKVRGPGRRTPG